MGEILKIAGKIGSTDNISANPRHPINCVKNDKILELWGVECDNKEKKGARCVKLRVWED